MISLRTPLVIASALIAATLFLSWNLLDDRDASSRSSLLRKDKLADEAMYGFLISDEDSGQINQQPVAEDVLVQRIPGDNEHLLLMAFYSKENYSEPSLTIVNGFAITLKDDGIGDDKVAGDGLYTAKIPADVKAFRDQAIDLSKKMKEKKYSPIRYHIRQRLVDADAFESFDLAKFDAHQPVSISGLTNALSADFQPTATNQTSMLANSTANGTAAASSTSVNATATLSATPTTLDSLRKNSILITNLKVVEDSTRTWNYCTQKGNVKGAWTFGTLMRQLASKSPTQIASDSLVSEFVKNWLQNSWGSTHIINGDTVTGRAMVNNLIVNPWLTKSQKAGAPAGRLDMRFAPFKLMAIVNRFDLRNDVPLFGIPQGPCGESRFVFCLIDPNCGGPLQFTVIFEYGINKPNTCEAQHAWAQQWVNLKNFPLGSSAYNLALQSITDQFTKCGSNPSRPNQSSLHQLRTNEIALVLPTTISPKRWEFREFDLNLGNLHETVVKQNTADRYDRQTVNANVQRMASFVNQNQAKINAGTDTVPLTWQGLQFLGGVSRVNGPATGQPPAAYHWDGTSSGNMSTFITDDNARFNYSLQSCSGCHSGETQTAFTHINPVFFGREAQLSGFLSGVKGTGGAIDFDHDSANLLMQVQDAAMRPSTNPTRRNFNDIDRRARDLQAFASTTCGTALAISSQLMFQPTNMVH